MRVVLDTNILVSALIAPAGYPAAIYNAWEYDRFTLLTCAEHIAEVRATLRKSSIAALIELYKAGRLINQIKKLAANIVNLPQVRRSVHPDDDFLLALAEAGAADYLVTGDKSGLLNLKSTSGRKSLPPANSLKGSWGGTGDPCRV
jgi:putative PIN family toxin of toxin-antitoxin system